MNLFYTTCCRFVAQRVVQRAVQQL